MTTPYTRPELTKEEHAAANKDAQAVFRKHGINGVGIALIMLCMENRRLVKEINEHRAARGIDPLPTFEI